MIKMQAIAAMARNRVIGAAGGIPWHLPEDFRWFKSKTMGHTLVMGRLTYASIGRPLPGRMTVVVSASGATFPGTTTVPNLEALADIETRGTLFLCGGGELYRTGLQHCDDLFLSEVDMTPAGDVFFPVFESDFETESVLLEYPEFRVMHYRRKSRIAA